MKQLRHYLLIAIIVLAQWLAGAHAVAHAAGDEGALPAHTCELCLVAHDLASALPTLPVVLPLLAVAEMPPVHETLGRFSLPAPRAVQRGPPVA